MRVAIIGQQDFGKAVLEAMVATRRHASPGCSAHRSQPGAKSDPLRSGAGAQVPVYQLHSLKSPQAARRCARSMSSLE